MNTSTSEADSRAASRSIWVFTPSRTDPKDLEEILVQRHELLKDAVERVRESVLTAHKHHLLFVGPRGCGKTHLITLIVSRITADKEASEKLRLAWLNEDETCTSLLELLVKIHTALEKRYPGEFRAADLADAYELQPAAALDFISRLLLGRLGGKTLLVVTENLDALFESMGQRGQQQLRAFIQEHPQFAFVATAQRLVEDLSDRASPFFGFFQTEHLKPLSVDQATTLLQNIARIQGKTAVTEFLATSRGRSRVRALHHLSGGNHRIYIVLSQFITRETMDALIGPFLKMVDELTPYYQERVRWLPPLQRKIVEMLCTCDTTVPVKEIARRLFASQQTISSQLQALREKGYVESSQRGRESLYEISEPLMRICVEVKENQNTQPLRLLVDFLRVWYDDGELKKRLERISPETESYNYLFAAVQRNRMEGNLRASLLFRELGEARCLCFSKGEIIPASPETQEALLQAAHCWNANDIDGAVQAVAEVQNTELPTEDKALLCEASAFMCFEQGNFQAAISGLTSLIELPGARPEQVAKALVNRGITHVQKGDYAAAIDDYTRVIGLPSAAPGQLAYVLLNRGDAHSKRGDYAAAIDDYTQVIDLPGVAPGQVADALINRGVTHSQQGDEAGEIADYTRVIDLPGATPEQVADALFNRGTMHGKRGDYAAAIADYTRVIDLPGARPEQVADALINRGSTHGKQGDHAAAIADYTRVIDLPEATAKQVAYALLNRGLSHGQQGDHTAEITNYTWVINLPGAKLEQLVDALISRGITYGQQGDHAAAIADYTQVIDLPGATPEQVVHALYCRGATHLIDGQKRAAKSDFETTISLNGAPITSVIDAHFALGEIHMSEGQWSEAFKAIEASLGLGIEQSPGYFTAPEDIINFLFVGGLTFEGRCAHARTLYSLYTKHSATAVLGEALVKHLGVLFIKGEPWPASDNLDQWLSAWQQASSDSADFKLPLRLLSTGIDFLKSGGKDHNTLLNLTSPERSLLSQALGIEKSDD